MPQPTGAAPGNGKRWFRLACLAAAVALAWALAAPGGTLLREFLGRAGWLHVVALAWAGAGGRGWPQPAKGAWRRLPRQLGFALLYVCLATGEYLGSGPPGPWFGSLAAGWLGLSPRAPWAALALAGFGLGVGVPLWLGRSWPDLLEALGGRVESACLLPVRLLRGRGVRCAAVEDTARRAPTVRVHGAAAPDAAAVTPELPAQRVKPLSAAGAGEVIDLPWIMANLEKTYRRRQPAVPVPAKAPPVMMDVEEVRQRVMAIHGGRLPGSARRAAVAPPEEGVSGLPADAGVRSAEAPVVPGGPSAASWIPAVASAPDRPLGSTPAGGRGKPIEAGYCGPDDVSSERVVESAPVSFLPVPASPSRVVLPIPAHPLDHSGEPTVVASGPALTGTLLHGEADIVEAGDAFASVCSRVSAGSFGLVPVTGVLLLPLAHAMTPTARLTAPPLAGDARELPARQPEPPAVALATVDFDEAPLDESPELPAFAGSVPDGPAAPLGPRAQEASPHNPFRPRFDGNACLPPLSLLQPAASALAPISQDDLIDGGILIEEKLAEFRVKVNVLGAFAGPVITRYEVQPAVGVRGGQVVNLVKDLARALGVASIRVVETIPGKTCMGLELPNPRRQMIRLSEVLSSPVFQSHASKLAMVLGKDIAGEPVVADLGKAPHMLVAGTTGSGKSVGVNAMILSLLYRATPDEVRFVMIDPKMLELSVYDAIPHLLAPVVTDMKLAANALNWCVGEMERRYRLMSALGVRNLAGYNQKVRAAIDAGELLFDPVSITPDNPAPLAPLPYVVVVVDEFADLMMVAGKKIEELIARLAQKARAAGIHLILATQRPSVDVITGLIKANIPTRIAFQVSSKIDSRTILDQMGAEALLGQGDMLYLPPGTGYPQRVHGAFVADDEVHAVAEHLKRLGAPDYVEGVLSGAADAEGDGAEAERPGGEADPLYDEAVAIVIRSRRASISAVQRHLRIGYNRAARLIEQMEAAGVVSPMESNGSRTVLVPARE